MTSILQLVGPGGAGKTTVGPLLAARMGWSFLDLDAEFMRMEGDISSYIARHGYPSYARHNVTIYLEIMRSTRKAAVLALSSGFLTYASDVERRYAAIRHDVETDPLTALLLPSFEIERCVELIVSRQLGRSYLAGDRAMEERRIRERFPIFAALKCARFCSDAAPSQLTERIEAFARNVLSKSARMEAR